MRSLREVRTMYKENIFQALFLGHEEFENGVDDVMMNIFEALHSNKTRISNVGDDMNDGTNSTSKTLSTSFITFGDGNKMIALDDVMKIFSEARLGLRSVKVFLESKPLNIRRI